MLQSVPLTTFPIQGNPTSVSYESTNTHIRTYVLSLFTGDGVAA